jgi:hypothetical protein
MLTFSRKVGECKPLMMGKSAVCHVCDNFDVNVRGRELEQVRTHSPSSDQLSAHQSRQLLALTNYFYIFLLR